jgi:hypothetical protein
MDELSPDKNTDRSLDDKEKMAAKAIELAKRVDSAPTLAQKALALWAMPASDRYFALGALPAETVSALIEHNIEENTALLGNLPAQKFNEMVNYVPPVVGRDWLERAVTSGFVSAQMLPALLQPHDLSVMLTTAPEMRAVLPRLLNFQRATEMRSILHPMEWKNSLNDLLLADAEELLRKAPMKNRALKAVLQSLLDFFPELYLETLRMSLEAVKYREDHENEYEDITETPFELPEILDFTVKPSDPSVSTEPSKPREIAKPSPVSELIPAAADPFLALVTAKLGQQRREALEEELRSEIVATGSFAQSDIARSAERLLHQIRAGLDEMDASTAEAAAKELETKGLGDIARTGAYVAERIRQKSLRVAAYKDWLDRAQKQFLSGIAKLEPGIDHETGAPVLKVASRPGQPREEWKGYVAAQVNDRLEKMLAWACLARAAFTSPSRVQTIYATSKTRTAEEAARRTIIALCLYRRWEPELVHPGEDLVDFRKQFGDSLGRLNPAREIVLEALDNTPADAWKPADAKEKARLLLLGAIDELESIHPPLDRSRGREPHN